jgi:hypothetical protein
MIVNVGVGRIMLGRLLEGLERFGWITPFHVDASNLDPALCQRGCQLHRLLKVDLGAIGISDQEPTAVISSGTISVMEKTDLKVPRRLSASALPESHDIPCSMDSFTRLYE